uniref:Uncharacterized protein n=1 Tax=Siphoviridae sp. ctmpG14 TaxID=2825654 RepID=A0A8S5PCT2_9CAUD|nr:MAG TPA: hypothetical protein [Siphoviridae sp. ctmpG14]
MTSLQLLKFYCAGCDKKKEKGNLHIFLTTYLFR